MGPVSQPSLSLRILSTGQLENEKRSIRLVSAVTWLAGESGKSLGRIDESEGC